MAYPEGVIFEDDPDYDHGGYGSYDDDYPDRDDDPGFYTPMATTTATAAMTTVVRMTTSTIATTTVDRMP